jgi:DNA-binding SARP family transcriptional activator
MALARRRIECLRRQPESNDLIIPCLGGFEQQEMNMPHLSLSLLGGFEAKLDGNPLTSIKTDKARLLLIYLAVEHERPHRRQILAGLFWPDFPEVGARANLRHALANLRAVLAEDHNAILFILVEGETLQFNPESDYWIDALEFEKLAGGTTIDDLESAIKLYRGGFLEGFSLKDSPDADDWTSIQREHFQGLASAALGRLAERYEQVKDYEKAVRIARRRLTLEPWQEEAHRLVMRLLALGGQRAAALAQYEACCKILKEDLGVEPSAETQLLQNEIRDGKIFGMPQARVRLHNLPAQVTSFVGREKEIEQVKNMLKSYRIVTLTGPGGTGKTRLSQQAA